MIFLWNHHWFPSLKCPFIITICRSINNYFNEFCKIFIFDISKYTIFFKYVSLSTIRFLHHTLSLWYSLLFLSPMFVPSIHSVCLSFLSSSFLHLLSLSPSSVFLLSRRLLQILISSSPPFCLAHFLCLSLSLSILLYFSLTSLVYPFCLSRLSLYRFVFLSTFIFFVSLSLYPCFLLFHLVSFSFQ